MLKRGLTIFVLCCLSQTTHAASTVVGWAVRDAIRDKMAEVDRKASVNSTAEMAQTSTYMTGYIPVELPGKTLSMRLTYSSDPLLHSFQSTIDAIRLRKWTNAYLNEYQYHLDELNAARFWIEWLESNNYQSFGMCWVGVKQKRNMMGYYTKSGTTNRNWFYKVQSFNPVTSEVSNVSTNSWANVSGFPSALQQQIDTELNKCIYDQSIKSFQANDYYGYTHPNVWMGVHAALAEQIKWELDQGYSVPGLVWTVPPTSAELAELCTPQTCEGFDPDDPDGTGGGGSTPPADPNAPYVPGTETDRCGNAANLNLFQKAIAGLFQPCQDWATKFNTLPAYQTKIPFGLIDWTKSFGTSSGSGPLVLSFNGVQIEGNHMPTITLDSASNSFVNFWVSYIKPALLGMWYFVLSMWLLRQWGKA